MSNQQKRMCKNCEFWESINDDSGKNIQGTCHYWPPARSQQIRSVTTEEVENPEIAELTLRLAAAKLLQTELISESKRTFEEYPVKRTYDEVQAARSKVEEGISNIDDLNSGIEEEKSSKPFVIKEIHHTRECGVWPVTASSDWCGQWRVH
jgi:hypothetical protein